MRDPRVAPDSLTRSFFLFTSYTVDSLHLLIPPCRETLSPVKCTKVFTFLIFCYQGGCPLIDRLRCSANGRSVLSNAVDIVADGSHPGTYSTSSDQEYVSEMACWCASKAEEMDFNFFEITNYGTNG